MVNQAGEISKYLFKSFAFTAMIFAAGSAFSGCKDDVAKQAPRPEPPAKVQNEMPEMVKAIFDSKCATCHTGERAPHGIELDTYDSIVKGRLVIAGKPLESEIIEVIFLTIDEEDHMPPADKPQLEPEEYDAIYDWVSEGAKNAKGESRDDDNEDGHHDGDNKKGHHGDDDSSSDSDDDHGHDDGDDQHGGNK